MSVLLTRQMLTYGYPPLIITLAMNVLTVEGGGGVLVLHEDATAAIAGARLPERGDLVVVVGPEGGISERELAGMLGAGAVAVRLGPHVLRTSTAGPVALALLAQRLGRWA